MAGYNSRLHHIGVGRAYKSTRVKILIHNQHIKILNLEGQLLRELTLDLWVPNWSSASCDLGVFVYQSTEQIARRREAGMVTQAVVVTNGRPRVPLTGAENQGQSNAHNWIRRRGHGARPEGIVVSSARSGSSPR
jgi:hypothetical protein